MKYQIDQSGKIENTKKQTALAASNHNVYAVVISAKTKRQFQEICRRDGLTRLYVYILFAIGIYMILSKLKTSSSVIIDTEYPGKEKLIKNLIKVFLKGQNADITFSRIGNNPKVHYAAHDVYIQKKQADRVISLKEILRIIKKTDGRLRECLATLVGAQTRSIKEYYQPKNKKSRPI